MYLKMSTSYYIIDISRYTVKKKRQKSLTFFRKGTNVL